MKLSLQIQQAYNSGGWGNLLQLEEKLRNLKNLYSKFPGNSELEEKLDEVEEAIAEYKYESEHS